MQTEYDFPTAEYAGPADCQCGAWADGRDCMCGESDGPSYGWAISVTLDGYTIPTPRATYPSQAAAAAALHAVGDLPTGMTAAVVPTRW